MYVCYATEKNSAAFFPPADVFHPVYRLPGNIEEDYDVLHTKVHFGPACLPVSISILSLNLKKLFNLNQSINIVKEYAQSVSHGVKRCFVLYQTPGGRSEGTEKRLVNFPFGIEILPALLASRLPAHPAPRIAAALAEITIGTWIFLEDGFFLPRMFVHFLVYVNIRSTGKYPGKKGMRLFLER